MKVKVSVPKKAAFKDKKIKCVDCRKVFVFSAEEQKFFMSKGWKAPIRCKKCRKIKKAKGKNILIGLDHITGRMGTKQSTVFNHAQTYGPSHCVNGETTFISGNYGEEE
ncbi:MAG: zinc-ribbon domain containing protein [Anaerolineaceae bacterium]|nr:zinc-ribbon domain containing protein [Anaerolineaceae bacterium]